MTEKKRRIPTQGRARATVEAILEASFQILDEEGMARLTTNHVAERAGVSIGTLYQYFADRDDLLAELGQRQARSVRNLIVEIISDAPERGAIRAIIQALKSGMSGSPETRIALTEALFRVRGEGVLGAHHLAFIESLGEGPEGELPLSPETAFILTHAPIVLLRAAAAEPQLRLDADRLEDQLVLLIESYLGALATD